MKPEQKKWGVRILVVLIVGTGVIAGFWPDSISVRTQTVRTAPLRVTLQEEGVTRFENRYLVVSPASGTVDVGDYVAGDRVAEGDVLAVLRSSGGQVLDQRQLQMARARISTAQLALKQASESLDQATQQEAFSLTELQRASMLAEQNIGSERQREQAQLNADQATAQRKLAEYAVNIAEYEQASAEAALGMGISSDAVDILPLHAPADALLLTITDERERFVLAGTPLMELANPVSMQVEVDVLSSDAVQLRAGMPMRVIKWGGEEMLGSVERVEPGGFRKISALGVEEQRVRVIGHIPVIEGLGNHYRVVAEFELWKEDSVLQVPSSALFRMASEWGVFRVENGRAVLRTVTIGREAGEWTQVVDGIEEGDRVIVDPDERIENGVRISEDSDS